MDLCLRFSVMNILGLGLGAGCMCLSSHRDGDGGMGFVFGMSWGLRGTGSVGGSVGHGYVFLRLTIKALRSRTSQGNLGILFWVEVDVNHGRCHDTNISDELIIWIKISPATKPRRTTPFRKETITLVRVHALIP